MTPLALETVWTVSIAAQWLVILALVLVALALVRQVGALSESLGSSVGQAGTQTELALGSRLPGAIPLVGGGGIEPEDGPVLLVWHEPGCEGCRVIEQPVLEVGASEPPGAVLVITFARGDAAVREAEGPWRGLPVASEPELPPGFDVPRVPWAIAVTADGHVAARGRPETAQDLRTMLAAARSAERAAGPDSVRRHAWGESLPYWEAADTAGDEPHARPEVIADGR